MTFDERCGAAEGEIVVDIREKSISGKENSQNKAKIQVPIIFRCQFWILQNADSGTAPPLVLCDFDGVTTSLWALSLHPHDVRLR